MMFNTKFDFFYKDEQTTRTDQNFSFFYKFIIFSIQSTEHVNAFTISRQEND